MPQNTVVNPGAKVQYDPKNPFNVGVAGTGNFTGGAAPTVPVAPGALDAPKDPGGFPIPGAFIGGQFMPTPQGGSAVRYSPVDPNAPNALDVAEQKVQQSAQAEDPAAVHERISKVFAGEIAAIHQNYANLFNEQQRANEEASGRTRALAASSGVLGTSDIGNAMIEDARQRGIQQLRLLTEQENAEVQRIYTEGSLEEEKIIGEQRKEQTAADKAHYEDLLGKVSELRNYVKSVATSSPIESLDPQTYRSLYQQSGFHTPQEFEAYWNASRLAANRPNSQLVGNAASGYHLITVDPNTFKILSDTEVTKPLLKTLSAGQMAIDPSTGNVVAKSEEKVTVGKYRIERSGTDSDGNPIYKMVDTTTGQVIPSSIDARQLTPPSIFSKEGASRWSNEVSSAPPDPAIANRIDLTTGRTPEAIYQDAIAFAFEGGNLQRFIGGLSGKGKTQKIKDAINNKAAAIAMDMGATFPQLNALYKSNAAAATKFVTQALFVKTYLRTATDNLDLALQKSGEVGRTDAKLVNNYVQWAQGNFTPAGSLAEFETYIYTASREYAKVTSGGAMSAQGLTDSAQREAAKLLNAAQSPEAFVSTVGAMKQDMKNVIHELDGTVQGISQTLGVPQEYRPQPVDQPIQTDTLDSSVPQGHEVTDNTTGKTYVSNGGGTFTSEGTTYSFDGQNFTPQ